MPEITCGHVQTAVFRCELSDNHLEYKCVINVETDRGKMKGRKNTQCLIMPSNVIDLRATYMH